MKFIHMSDLHIGKSVNGFSMLEEQRYVFSQITAYIRLEKPTAVLIAGDIYDRAVPQTSAVRLFDDFLTELFKEDVAVLLISGNHDSPERLNYASRLLSEQNLHLCGAFDGTLRNVTLRDEFGGVRFWLLPFIKPSTVRGSFGEIESYGDAVSAVLKNADIDYSGRNVLLSHQFYKSAGISPARCESELDPIGGLDAVSAELIFGFDYAALGHLHGAQSAGGNLRYAGSPLKYSFSECRQIKSVTLAELREKGSLKTTPLPLKPIHDMREIKGSLDEILRGESSEDYLRVTLTDEEEIIDPMGKIRSVYPNVMALCFENSRFFAGSANISAKNIKKLSPYDLFCEFFLETGGAVMSGEQAEIARELLEEEI
ncbi:nuclease SbcCD subunit D [Clostridia bacterium]|nr:nuclease SbcCD subunit D [Clostridia bacterium]